MIKVTIGIPTYNQSGYIESAVESALSQDYPELEVVVVDDCSTDGTDIKAKQFLADPRFKFFQNTTNLGRVKNYRNLLYNLASGEWYLNLDGDDLLIDTRYVSRAVEIVESLNGIVFVYAKNRDALEKTLFEKAVYTEKDTYPYSVYNGTDFFFSIPKMRKNRLNHLTCLYNRREAMAIDFYRAEIISSDYESLYRLALRGKVVFIDAVVAKWRKHENNISSTTDFLKMADNYSLFTKVHDYAREIMPHESSRLHKWLDNSMARKLYANILTLIGNRDVRAAGKIFTHCMELNRSAALKTIFNPKLYLKIILNEFFRIKTWTRRKI
jgi:glycosyltransferase involved in cell wall biosynthesis